MRHRGLRIARPNCDRPSTAALPLPCASIPLPSRICSRSASAREPYAVRLSEISGLFADKTITRVPGGAAALLGIAGFRGAIVPVYGLRALLGHSGAQSPRWLVIATAAPVALAFEVVRRPSARRRGTQFGRGIGRCGNGAAMPREFIRTQDVVRPVLHLPSVLNAIAKGKRTEKHKIAPNEE